MPRQAESCRSCRTLGRTNFPMRVFVYSPQTHRQNPVQIALDRENLSRTECRHYADLMCFRTCEPLGEDWVSPPMLIRRDRYDDAQLPELCDFPIPYDSHALVMGEKAMVCLSSFLRPFGELLPLESNEGRYWILNVTRVVDALDLEMSEWLPVEGAAPILWRPAFKQEVLKNEAVFRLPSKFRKSQTYFTQLLVDEISRHRLTGFDTREVWSSEWSR